MTDLSAAPVASAGAAARVLSRLEEAAWVLAGFDHLVRSGALSADGFRPETNEDRVAARMLAAVGLVVGDDHPEMASGLIELLADGSLDTRRQAMISTLRQVATAMGIVAAHDAEGWAAQDDATLLAQGKSSALGGQMLAMYAIPSLEGLSERFAAGGDFLDVGVGVAELAAAFCEALPNASCRHRCLTPCARSCGADDRGAWPERIVSKCVWCRFRSWPMWRSSIWPGCPRRFFPLRFSPRDFGGCMTRSGRAAG